MSGVDRLDLLRHWKAMPLADGDALGAALLEAMDEDEAMAAIQIMRDYTVPNAAMRGAVEALREIAKLPHSGADDSRAVAAERGRIAREALHRFGGR